MAEVLGAVASTLTLAGVFSNCIHAFEAFYIARERKSELRTLFLQFKLQEARLWTWGRALGWVSSVDRASAPTIPAECEAVIQATLQRLFELITDGTILKDKYGCLCRR
jgi:hypothetical protein